MSKTVWITGASSGIGAALARQYSQSGDHVILSARNIEKLEVVKASLAHPDKATIATIDLMNPESIIATANDVLSKHDIDILINNAGRSQRSKVIDTDIKVYRELMELNYFGVIHLTKLVFPQMVKRQTGHIAAISSVAGKIGAPYRSGYAGSKHALHGFFDCLRSEAYHEGIGVTIICPGFVNTDISKNAIAADGSKLNKVDPENANGMQPDVVAKRITQAIARNKAEVYIGGKELLGIHIKRFFPSLLNRILKQKTKGNFGE